MRRVGVGIASIVGSFVVYGAHVACGGATIAPRVVPSAPAQTASVVSSASAAPPPDAPPPVKDGACGCAPAKTTAYFVVSGDEKVAIDPVDARAALDVDYGRGPGGKRLVVLTAVVRGYRLDVPAERPTTFSLRLAYPEGTTPPSSPKDLEAHLTTWGAGSVVAPRTYATVAKSALTVTVTDSLIELRGSVTLKDVPTGRTLVVDKLAIRKSGSALLPDRSGVFRP